MGFSGHKGRGADGPPASHPEGGSDDRFSMLPGDGPIDTGALHV